MSRPGLFSEKQLDYLVEMVNIGAGNATTALNHLLQCAVDMKMPGVNVLPAEQATAALGDPAAPVACLRMRLVGDLDGYLFFLVPDDQKAKLAELAERSLLGPGREDPDPERVLAALAEIGNILAGVYLTAIHDFCRLNVCHSVPVLAVDMLQALLDESIATQTGEGHTIILVTNEFLIGQERFRTFFLIFPTRKSTTALVDSMREAGKLYGYKPD
jgi:chemotaxis protein CheC